MRFLEKIGHWLFLYSLRKRLVNLHDLEFRYKNTNSEKFIWEPLHKSYTNQLKYIRDLNSKHFTFNTVIKYIQHKMTYIEGQFKNAQ